MELQLPRGVRDFGPAEKLLRDEITNTLKRLFEVYGFNPIETPIIERWDVLSAKYGGGEEILKETYALTDQGKRELGLRYDLTTPLARFMGMNPNLKKPFKRYHIGTVYRDGPIKKGRYREFYQCDVDTIGANSMLADAECIQLALDFFEAIDFNIEIRVNNRKLLFDLAIRALGASDEDQALSFVLSLDKLEKIERAGVTKELSEKGFASGAIDAVFESLNVQGGNVEMVTQLAQNLNVENAQWQAALDELFGYVDDPRVRFVPTLARGLGYYTGTVFEVFMPDGSLNSAVAAGGRYDNLISDFLGSTDRIPAVGISFGLEPIIELIKEKRGQENLKKSAVQVYIATVAPEQTRIAALGLLKKLRAAGIPSDMDLIGRGPSANFKYADAYGIPYVLVIGPNELEADAFNLKNMTSGEQLQLPFEEILEKLRDR